MEGSVSHPETAVAKPAKHWLQSGKKLRSLNGIRAFAILLVFFHHMTWSIPDGNAAVNWVKYFCYQGWIGVDLFFVLS